MKPVEIVKDVYWVGAIDYDVRNFHGYSYTTHHGTTYNAYLIVGEKVALVDAVLGSFSEEMFSRISKIINPEKLDYMISNHTEMDHSGSIPDVLKIMKNAKLVCTPKAVDELEKHYPDGWDIQTVKTGDEIDLGGKTLRFYEAPMLHWPESMFTYYVEEEALLPNDAFGQHYATEQRFADEVDQYTLWKEAGKYYANILWPLSRMVQRKIEEVIELGLPIKIIAPSHGLIWRKDPLQIVTRYLEWAKGERMEDKVVITWDTMWQSTTKLARAIAEGISSQGLNPLLRLIPHSDRSDIMAELLEARGIIVGSSTLHNDILPTVAPILSDFEVLKPKGKKAAAFGSFGWGGGAVKRIQDSMERGKMEIVMDPFTVKWVPTEAELNQAYQFGVDFAKKVK
ncbi:MAG: FprA family A-type flavoprotein [Candidatus Thorarchaeota archaeon SMTZ1-83]|nr:MAG: MBL fold metallo-hydrolase [Candidatus Thorarchaeota archaeon SMTZ1-83]